LASSMVTDFRGDFSCRSFYLIEIYFNFLIIKFSCLVLTRHLKHSLGCLFPVPLYLSEINDLFHPMNYQFCAFIAGKSAIHPCSMKVFGGVSVHCLCMNHIRILSFVNIGMNDRSSVTIGSCPHPRQLIITAPYGRPFISYSNNFCCTDYYAGPFWVSGLCFFSRKEAQFP
jgi:hypothetical protein